MTMKQTKYVEVSTDVFAGLSFARAYYEGSLKEAEIALEEGRIQVGYREPNQTDYYRMVEGRYYLSQTCYIKLKSGNYIKSLDGGVSTTPDIGRARRYHFLKAKEEAKKLRDAKVVNFKGEEMIG